jgi:N utilization substance protein A
MEGLDLKQLTAMVGVIAEEKGLPEDVVLDVVQMAIAAAWRRDNGDKDMNVRALLDVNTGKAKVFVSREVIEDGLAYNPATEMPLEEALKLNPEAKIGDQVEEATEVTSFGRVASMAAKQVVIQRLREAERDAVLSEFEDKIGTVVTGVVARVEPRVVRIDMGRANGIMPRSEQIDGEYYTVGERLKVYIKGVEHDDAKAQLILSRGNAEFIEYLFRQEVPELENGSVEIRGIAREAGRRTKIAVMSTVPGVDPVGTFVGGRGVRVQAIMNEIGEREKIDIINWSDNPSEYIREALSPAEVVKVEIEGKRAKVYVTEDQQSIAIGRQGQNVRLASKLTGYELDIELAKAPEKKKRKNAEDSLLNALSAASDEGSAEASVEEAAEASSDVAEKVPEAVEKADEKTGEVAAAEEALDKVVEIDGEEKTSTAEE